MEGLGPHDVGGHQAAAEQHGKKQEEREEIPAGQIFSGKRIGIQGRQGQVADGSADLSLIHI